VAEAPAEPAGAAGSAPKPEEPGWPEFPSDPVPAPAPASQVPAAEEPARPRPPLPPKAPPEGAEPFKTRSDLEAELADLRAEVPWWRGARERQIPAKRQIEEEVRQLVAPDPLTGAVSARRFADRLAVAVVHAQRYKQKLAVMHVGLDRLASINERLGRH